MSNQPVRRAVIRVAVALGAVVVALSTSTVASGGVARAASPFQPVPGQYYQVIAKHNGECLMTRSWTYAEQMVTRGCDGTVHQNWKFVQVPGTDFYRVSNQYTDYCLDVAWGNYDDWANVVQANCLGAGGNNQQWAMVDTQDGFYLLTARHSGKCLDISWGWAVQYHCTNWDNERFRFQPR